MPLISKVLLIRKKIEVAGLKMFHSGALALYANKWPCHDLMLCGHLCELSCWPKSALSSFPIAFSLASLVCAAVRLYSCLCLCRHTTFSWALPMISLDSFIEEWGVVWGPLLPLSL